MLLYTVDHKTRQSIYYAVGRSYILVSGHSFPRSQFHRVFFSGYNFPFDILSPVTILFATLQPTLSGEKVDTKINCYNLTQKLSFV